ncbi:uncharacterized protein LOC124357361 isoform X2 [Homalodisca vitripennis]|uniref:uncharacterized protein LOC124357361 isoform X2 n=1 Tax=Homalodisca vitripennis TaxID=197043 RepID=UPI001EEC1BD1|nr:uncharacterized protein LOC124357361 isoform X2 [Homalodisca vitripennis]
MAGSSTFSRLLIVNGHPYIMKDEIGLNPVQSFGSDILQQAIDDVTTTGSISPGVDSNNISIINPDQTLNVNGSGRNEYVAVLSNDQNPEETSTISLTLEQAAELGLHVAVDSINQNLEPNSNLKEVDISSGSNQYIHHVAKSDESNETDCIKLDSHLCSFTQNVLHEDNPNDSFLDTFNTVSLSKDQQITLVPNIVNGSVTYTLQLSNQNITELENSEFFRLGDSSSVGAQNSVESGLKLDLDNLATSSDLHFINSPVDIVSNKTVDNSAQSDMGNSNSNQTYGLVSCNSENVTFLSLSDAIPVSTNISDIVTHVNNVSVTQQSKLVDKAPCRSTDISKQKLFVTRSGESLLLKQRNADVCQNGISNKNPQLPKSKTKQILSRPNQVSTLPSKGVNESLNCQLNIPVEPTIANDKDFSSFLKSNNTDKPDTLPPEVEYVASSKQSEIVDNRTEIAADGKVAPTIIIPRKGDVPKEVSVALSRIPIKTDSKKPLGSNENPIQLVQQGSTFHSMQALTEDHISKIKPILQENFDSRVPSKNVVYDPTSNTRIIYRIISPAEVSLRKQDEFPRRRGRPKKIRTAESQPEECGEGVPPPKKAFPRTRSGRLSRPPKHMVRDYKHIRRAELDDSDGAYSDYQSDHEEELAPSLDTAPVDLLPGLVAKRKNHKRNISADNLCPTCGKIYLGYVRMKRHFDKYPDHGSIEYLNSVRNSQPDSEAESGAHLLWKKRMGRKKGRGKNNFFMTADKRTRLKEALDWCQSKEVAEIAGPAVASVLSLWELLMLRVDCVKQDSRVAALYNELCQLLCKLRQMAHRLFRPLDHPLPPGTKHVTVQVEDEIMTGLLDLPCGIYLASDEDLNENISTPTIQEHSLNEPQMPLSPTVPVPIPVIDKKETEKPAKMDIDEVPQPFLLNTEEMICDTDDRSLVNVDEIVSERLQNFTGSQSSTVDELMKGLNELDQRSKLETDDLMEGFSIVSRRTHVSASTEDLMKSLEHFESHLNHADAPSSLDRDTFDRVSNVDTLDFEVLSREFHSNNR